MKYYFRWTLNNMISFSITKMKVNCIIELLVRLHLTEGLKSNEWSEEKPCLDWIVLI